MNVRRNGIAIQLPSHRRYTSKIVEGKLLNKPVSYKGSMIEMYMMMDCGNEASVIMPARKNWIKQYKNEGWKERKRWVV